MRIADDPKNRSAFVFLVETPISGDEIELSEDVIACLDDSGMLIALDLMNTPRFGVPFDAAAAERAVAWAREQLAMDAAS